jgi:hypothetical protein
MAFTDNTTGGRVIQQGTTPYKITLTDTCEVGDLICFDPTSSEVWERADANGKVYALFVAGEPCRASGGTITAYREAVVTGFTEGEAGKLLYLSDTVGEYAGLPTGNYHQCVGVMVSTTEAVIRADCQPKMGYASEPNSTGLGEAGFFRAELVDGVGASMFGALKLETKVNSTADTVPSARSLYIYHQTNHATTATEDNVIMRLEDGGSSVPNAFIELQCTHDAGPTYLISSGTGASTAIKSTGTCSTQSGWLKCWLGSPTDGAVRYIALYTTVA